MITPLPALDRTSPTFKQDTDTFFASRMPTFSVETEAARVEINTNTLAAQQAATTAAQKAESTVLDAQATAADRIRTGQDAQATAADRHAVEQALSGGPVLSIGGATGIVKVKTINGESVIGEGNILFPLPEAVLAPTNVTPANGSIDLASVTLIGSPYYSLYGKPQKARQARVSLSPVFDSIAWDSGAVAGSAVTVTGPNLDGLIPNSTAAYWQMRYQDESGQWSAWSQPTSFTTVDLYIPTIIGQPSGGGFYAGKIKVGTDAYAVIIAPKSAEATVAWKSADTSTSGAASTADGLTNSGAMNNTQHPAAKHCRDYRGGGKDDWYLPAKSELDLQYRAFKPSATVNDTSYGANPDSVPTASNYTAGDPAQTTVDAFKSGGAEAFVANYYWSSTQASAAAAWMHHFGNGVQWSTANKSNAMAVRPVRRILLPA